MADNTRGEDWLAGQVAGFAADRPHWKTYGAWLETQLQAAADAADVAAIVQARAKTVASFAEKAIRKQHKYADPRHQLTDLCGARVIVASLEELAPICEFIESSFLIDRENSLDQRSQLRPREFGYRSVHYVVAPKPGSADVPPEIWQRKAEIQVRTILQHGWADIGHDRLYKRSFQIPESWDRDAGRIAAMLEEADEMFGRIIRQVDPYHVSAESAVVGSARAAEDELQLLRTTLAHCGSPPPRNLLIRFGRLALALHHDDLVMQWLDPHLGWGDPHLLYCCGQARCRQFAGQITAPAYEQGLSELRQASALLPREAGFQLAYAEAAREADPAGSERAIEAAFHVAPTDPQVLVAFMRLQVRLTGNVTFVRLLTPLVRSAMTTAKELVDAGINRSLNGLLLAEMLGLLGNFEQSLATAIDALGVAHSSDLLLDSEQAWHRLETATAGIAVATNHWLTLRRLVSLVGAVKFQDPELLHAMETWTTPGIAQPSRPVVMLTGGCSAEATLQIAPFHSLLRESLADFGGTLISGGTTAGISGIAGELQASAGTTLSTRGYLPGHLPPFVQPDSRYRELYRTTGSDFSGLEIVQSWIDLVARGIAPRQVSVLGLNGGPLAAFEYRLGLVLGATVGIVQGSGRAADQILNDKAWSDQVLPLPADVATLKVFCKKTALPLFLENQRDALGRVIHAEYRQQQQARQSVADPSMSEWEQLPADLRASNLAQADDIGFKLQALGLAVQQVTDRPVQLYEFSPEQIERLAELEHARWNVERLQAGWRFAKERDTARRQSPYLVSWNDLSEEVRQWDRQAVALIPQLLRDAGYEITSVWNGDAERCG